MQTIGSSIITFTSSTQAIRNQIIEYVQMSQAEDENMTQQEKDEELEDALNFFKKGLFARDQRTKNES
jgi:hypothetical protein